MITFLSSFVKQLAGEQAPPAGPNGQGGEAGNTGGEKAFSRTFESVLGGNVPQESGEMKAAAAGESLGQNVSGEKGAMSRLTVSVPGMGRVAQVSGQGEPVPSVVANGSAAAPEGKAAETVSDESARNLQAEKTGKSEGENVAPRAGGKTPEGAEKGNSNSGNPDASGASGDAQPAKAADPALNGARTEQAQVSSDGEGDTAVKSEPGSKPPARPGGSPKAGNSHPLDGNAPKTAGPQTVSSGEKAAASGGSEAGASSGQPEGSNKASAATGGQPKAGQKGELPNGSQIGRAGSPAMNGDTGKIMENGRPPSSGETGKSGTNGGGSRSVTSGGMSVSGTGPGQEMPAGNIAARPSPSGTSTATSSPGSSENGTVTQNGLSGKSGGSGRNTHSAGANSGGNRSVTPGGMSVSGQGTGQAMPAENSAWRPSPAKTISTDPSAGSTQNGTAAQNGSSGGEARSGQSAGDSKGNNNAGRSASSGREAGTPAGKAPRTAQPVASSGVPESSPAKSGPPAISPGAAGEAGVTPPKLSPPLSSGQMPDMATRAENAQGAVFQPISRVTEAEKEFIPTLKSTEGEFKISSNKMMDTEMSGERDFSGSEEGDRGEMRKLEPLNSSLLQSSSARRKLGVQIGRVVRQELAQSQGGQDAQWRHHRFVLDDGKSVNVSFRQADGAIQVQLGTGNAELNRLLQQNMDEIRQHLRQELDVEVDLEFQNFEGGEFREGHPERPGRSGRDSAPAGTVEGTQAEFRADGTRQTVRYLGFNTNEWTA